MSGAGVLHRPRNRRAVDPEVPASVAGAPHPDEVRLGTNQPAKSQRVSLSAHMPFAVTVVGAYAVVRCERSVRCEDVVAALESIQHPSAVGEERLVVLILCGQSVCSLRRT